MHDWRHYTESAIALFVIANPVGLVPVFISLCSSETPEDRNRTARITATTVAIVLVASVFVGQPLLQFFGISIASFRVAGGILIMVMAMAMLHAQPSRTHHTPEEALDAAAKDEIGVVPLGLPLVAGPGAISTIIIYEHQASDWTDTAYLILISILIALSVFLVLRLADPIRDLLGRTGINIVTRLLGLIGAAVAVEFITGGLVQLMPGLAGR